MADWYNVLVDFHIPMDDLPEGAASDLEGVFDNSIHVEVIGENMWQVAYPVFATSHDKAYRMGVDVIEAMCRANFGIWPEIIETHTYGPKADGQGSEVYRR